MIRKLNCVLLVDDDEPTNYLHEIILEEAGLTEKIVKVQCGEDALTYLLSDEEGHPTPDLLFLDLNMPGMNGWEFLEAYRQLDHPSQDKIVIIVLTTSIHPDDEKRARDIHYVKDFRHKPLTLEMLSEIKVRYFPDLLIPDPNLKRPA